MIDLHLSHLHNDVDNFTAILSIRNNIIVSIVTLTNNERCFARPTILVRIGEICNYF